MPDASGDRSKYFPGIEIKHGEPISLWIDRLHELGDAKYPDQIKFLRDIHGFSQTHANALVMHVRGSLTSKKFESPEEFLSTLDPAVKKTVQSIFAAITQKNADLELVIAWNQPMLRLGRGYVFGLSVAKNHITLNPFSSDVLQLFAHELKDYEMKKNTFHVPLNWKVDAPLLQAMAKARIAVMK